MELYKINCVLIIASSFFIKYIRVPMLTYNANDYSDRYKYQLRLLLQCLSADRTSLVQLDSGGGFKCFSQLDCPNTDFIWCFNLYHPTESIEICWDSNSTVINRTEHAITLGLETYFTVGEVSHARHYFISTIEGYT